MDLLSIRHIIYSGSFDPPHLGHVDCVRLALKNFPNAEVIVMPSPSPASVPGAHKALMFDFDERFKFCEWTFHGPHLEANLHSRVKISDFENHLPTPNFSFHTVVEFIQLMKEQGSSAFMIGSDQFESFSAWKNPEEILSLVKVIVIKRGGQKLSDFHASNQKQLEKFPSNLRGQFIFLEQDVNPCKSRDIRADLEKNLEIKSGVLDERVQKFVRFHTVR